MNPRALLKNLAMPLALVAITVFFAIKEPAFIGSRNLTQLFVEFSIIGTLALGMFMILLTGQIDLSVGSGVGLIGGIAAGLIVTALVMAMLAIIAWRARAARRAHGLPVRASGKEAGAWIAAAAAAVGLTQLLNQFRGVPLTLLILAATAGVVYFLTKHTP